MGIRPAVSAWLSSKVDVPLTLGHLKPVILLPVAMINHLTPQQVEAILVHELAHIRRHDYLLHLAVTALEGFFFFNPFARLLIRQVKKKERTVVTISYCNSGTIAIPMSARCCRSLHAVKRSSGQ